MTICAVQEVSPGCLKLTASERPSFFIRVCYLDLLAEEKLTALISYSLTENDSQAEFSEEESADIEQAAKSFLAEKCALGYIGRAEHCRFLLSRKLEQKGFSGTPAQKALDFLESKDFLSDLRYARAFLHSRALKNEGRTRLSAELKARGVKSEDAKKALDEYFCERDESEMCIAMCSKIKKQCADETKIYAKLLRAGFQAKTIRQALKATKNLKSDSEGQ